MILKKLLDRIPVWGVTIQGSVTVEKLRRTDRNLFKDAIRRFRSPILRFLSQGDLILVGDILAKPGQPALVQTFGSETAEIIGTFSVSPDNPGCIVAPGCRPPTPKIRTVQSGDFSDPGTWGTNTSTQEAQ